MRFHWSLPPVAATNRLRGVNSGPVPDQAANLQGQLEFCRRADTLGIDSMLLPIGYQRPDPVTLAGVFGAATENLRFMVAARSGVVSPTYFVQQINTVSALTNGRVSVNAVLGHSSAELRYYGDFLDHDERYRRTDEFWTICDALWRRDFPVDFAGDYLRVEGATINNQFVSPERSSPEVYFSGSSEQATRITLAHGDSLLCIAEPPDELAKRVQPALDGGVEISIVCTQLSRPTRDEAVRAAYDIAREAAERSKNARQHFRRDKVESEGFQRAYELSERDSLWTTPYLWSGLVPYMGPPTVAMVGGPDEIVDAIFEYHEVGVSQFLFQGRPDLDTLIFFGEEILPRIRRREDASATSNGPPTASSAGKDGGHG
ncbi:MAG TPA: LLM class flavin-dependent oxidoreductase [Pseudonocardiaceae bacterium]|nr:LLM class flavin-dependent oxidoreductase [Pseudonocardiaceae bacterium]